MRIIFGVNVVRLSGAFRLGDGRKRSARLAAGRQRASALVLYRFSIFMSSYHAAGPQPLTPPACLASLPLPPVPCGGNCCVWMLALVFLERLLKGKAMQLTATDPNFIPFGYLPDFHTPKSKPPNMNPIRIYVACLAAYNNGFLHGCWIDAALGESHIWEAVRLMLAASPEDMAEEWAIHDYEGFEGAPISEWTSFERIAALAEFIEAHGPLGGKLIAHYGGELDDAKTALEHYFGEYESLEDYARSQTEGTSEIPENLAYYIDYKAMGRDWENSGDIFTIETAFDEVHIFGAW